MIIIEKNKKQKFLKKELHYDFEI